MRSVPVVAVKPSGQLGCAFVRGVIGTGIGPLAQARLDEALSLAVSFGRVRLGSDVFEGELLAGFGEVPREIARAVVGPMPRWRLTTPVCRRTGGVTQRAGGRGGPVTKLRNNPMHSPAF